MPEKSSVVSSNAGLLLKAGDVIPTLYRFFILGVWWVASWLVVGTDFAPHGLFFSLGLLYICATLSGNAVKQCSKRLPPLVGMMVCGLILRNLPLEKPLLQYGYGWSNALRNMALAVIMVRAGLGLDLAKLRKFGLVTFKLAAGPCLAETATVAGLSAALLKLPGAWCMLLGFVIAAVSPAVVVPGMLDLQSKGYGTAKGIPSLVVAAASFDDVLAICGFGICLALVGSNDTSLAWLIFKGPVELLLGILSGLVLGWLSAAPTFKSMTTAMQTLSVLGGAIMVVFGGKATGFSGGGALAAVVLGCTAAQLWGPEKKKPVAANVNTVWGYAQPALFGLLGAAVRIEVLQPNFVGLGLVVLVGSLCVRLVVTRLVVSFGSGLNSREAAFISLAWSPKATVQAAVGGVALDLVRERGMGRAEQGYAEAVLMLSVLVILLTAPLGAVLIAWMGPRWLELEDKTAPIVDSRSSTMMTNVSDESGLSSQATTMNTDDFGNWQQKYEQGIAYDEVVHVVDVNDEERNQGEKQAAAEAAAAAILQNQGTDTKEVSLAT